MQIHPHDHAMTQLNFDMNKPSFFLVGAPKAGTTAICDQLSQHPQIFLPRIKEPNFFDSDLQHQKAVSLREYLEYFPSDKDLICGEGSTWYLYSSVAAEKIKTYNPDAKIIICLRRPAEAVWSLYKYRQYAGIGDAFSTDLETLLNREHEILSRRNDPRESIDPKHVYMDTYRYFEQVERYIRVFGVNRVKIILYEDFTHRSRAVYMELLEFLEVTEYGFSPVNRRKNPTGSIRNRKINEALAHLPFPIKKFAYLFPSAIRRPVYNYVRGLNTSWNTKPIAPGFHAFLTAEFRPDVRRLSKLIGRDLSDWLV